MEEGGVDSGSRAPAIDGWKAKAKAGRIAFS